MALGKINTKISTQMIIVLGVICLTAGTATSTWLAFSEDTRMRSELMIQSRIIAASINPFQLDDLTGTQQDTYKENYRRLKSQLILLRSANPLCRFIYLTCVNEKGELYILIDSEPEGSNDYSPPGELYQEASPEFKAVFSDAQAIVEGPVPDRWGNWVSALIPIFSDASPNVSAVLGTDVNARDWYRNIIFRVAPAVSMTVLFLSLLTFFYVLFRRDESARLRLEDSQTRLRESERAYRNIVVNMLDVFFRMDAEGIIRIISPSAGRLLGYAIDELIGKNATLWVLPEVWQQIFAEIQRSGEIRDREFMVQRKDGAEMPISVTMQALRNDTGEIIGCEGIARDITDRKIAEKQQKEMEKQIQHAQKMEVIGALAGGVAHDLNNILSGIVSYPDLLLLQLPLDSPLRKSIEIIKESGMKAGVIVQDLLTLSRRGVPASEVVNLNQSILEYLASPEYGNQKCFHPLVEIKTHLDHGLFNMQGSPVHIFKTIMNLVTNAVEAIPEKGCITVATYNRYVDFAIKGYDAVQEGDYVVMEVADSGNGITPQDLSRIFEPFFTRKKMGRSGSGLGLAVVWGTVKDHKGYIDVQSRPGQGTVFILYFPATREMSSPLEKSFTTEQYKGHGEKILIIDDTLQQREIATAILERQGYCVHSVASGEEGIDYLWQNLADLIVLDMSMDPGLDGLDTYRRIIAGVPGQKAIIASGYSETERVREVQRLGAGRYLRKPYSLIELAQAVKEALAV